MSLEVNCQHFVFLPFSETGPRLMNGVYTRKGWLTGNGPLGDGRHGGSNGRTSSLGGHLGSQARGEYTRSSHYEVKVRITEGYR